MIAHPGWISRFRYFSPAPFATQKKLGVCLLSPPTPRFGFDPPPAGGSKNYIVHRFRRRHLRSLSFQLEVSKPSRGKKEVWATLETAMVC